MAVSSIKKNGILNGGIIGFTYIFGIYILSSIIVGSFGISTSSIIMMIAGILAGVIGGIVGVNLK